MPQKAHDLRHLTENFLSSNLEENYPRSDAHYGTLSFLLCMSDRPLHATYAPLQLSLSTEEEEVEWFDWNKHLMEGIEYSSTDDSSSSSEVGELGLISNSGLYLANWLGGGGKSSK